MKINNDTIESFLNCKYKSFLKHKNKEGEPHDYEILINQLGFEYRQRFLAQISAQNNIIEWSNLKANRVNEFAYCIEPVFESEDYQIKFDFAEIKRISARKWSFVPICIITREKVSKTEKLAACIKIKAIDDTNNFEIDSCKVIYGKELKVTAIKVSNYQGQSDRLLLSIRKYLTQTVEPRLFRNNHCKICEFKNICETKLIEKDDLSLLGGMNKKRVLKLNNKGLFSIQQLSYTFRPRKYKQLKNVRERHYPALKALAIRENRIYVWKVRDLPKAKTEIFLDIESLTDENFYYLIGVIVRCGKKETRFSFWAESKEDEQMIFKDFFALIKRYDDSVIYHFSNYEVKALRKINKRFEKVFDNQLKFIEERMVNLLPYFSINIYLPIYTNGLKDIGSYLGFSWSMKGASGMQSIVWRKNWERTLDNQFKEILTLYNLEDCAALLVLKDWLDSVSLNQNNSHSNVEDIKIPKSVYNWRNPDEYMTATFREINKFSYFDYQQNKVYIRTNDNLKKSKKREQRQARRYIYIKDKVNQIIEIYPKRCPNCKTRAKKNFELIKPSTKSVIDIKFMRVGGIKKWVKEIRGGMFKCKKCGKKFSPLNMRRQIGYGDALVKWCISNHIEHYIGFSSTARLLKDLNITIKETNKSQVFRFKEFIASEYSDAYDILLSSLIKGSLIQADETSVRIKSQPKGCVWVFATMDSVFYLFKPTRKAGFLKEVLSEFNGVLVSDFYSGYDSLPCNQQKCLIHLIRDLNADLYKNQLDHEFKAMVNGFGIMLRRIVHTIDRYGLKKRHLNKHKKEVDKYYKEFVNREYDSEYSKKYQKRFKKHWNNMFTFLNHDNIPWNNNNAEYAIKAFAQHRKRGNSTFTEKSINEYMVLLSIQQTLKYRGASFHEFLKSGEKNIDVFHE